MGFKKEITPFIELFAAIVLSFVIVLGMIHNLIKPFYDYRKRRWDKRIVLIFSYWINIVVQAIKSVLYLLKKVVVFIVYFVTLRFWKAIKFIVHEVARTIDLIGNVAAGELIEDIITPMEDTYFGIGDITISSAIGHVEYTAKRTPSAMNPRGWWLTKTLNFCFGEKAHSVDSYQKEIVATGYVK